MIVITGSGRAGTSITAKLFAEMGFDLGRDNKWFDKYRAGYEPLGIVRLNEAVIASGVWGRSYTPPARRDALVRQFRERMHELAGRQQVAKDPRFAVTLDLWHQAGVPIEYVVVCIRTAEECIESAVETGAGFALEGPESMLRGYHELIARIGCLFQTLALRGIPFGILRYDHFIEDFLRLKVPLPDNAEDILRANFAPSTRRPTESAWTADDETLERLGQQYPCSFPSRPEPPDAVQRDFERVVNWIHPHAPKLPRYEAALVGANAEEVVIRLRSPFPPEVILQGVWLEGDGDEQVDLLPLRDAAIVLENGRWVRETPGGMLIRFDAGEGVIRCRRHAAGQLQNPARLRFDLLASGGKPAAEGVGAAGEMAALTLHEAMRA